MSSNLKFQKECELCGKNFTAQKISTKYCIHACSRRAYKQKVRQNRIDEIKNSLLIKPNSTHSTILKEREFMNVTQAADLLGISRSTMYRYIRANAIKYNRIMGKTFIRRMDIDQLFESSKNEVENTESVSPRKPDFTKRYSSEGITEWYTSEEIQRKFNMKATSVYSFAYTHNIPRKREDNRIFYSKTHIDAAKGVTVEEEFYYIEEAMRIFGISRDSLYRLVREYKIPKRQEGRYVKISKPHLDKLLQTK